MIPQNIKDAVDAILAPYISSINWENLQDAKVKAEKEQDEIVCYNRREAANLVGLSLPSIDRALKAKKLRCCKLNGRVVITKKQIQQWLKSNQS